MMGRGRGEREIREKRTPHTGKGRNGFGGRGTEEGAQGYIGYM
jgi:hypothetical protein